MQKDQSTEQEKEALKKQEENLLKITIPPRTIMIYTTQDCPVQERPLKQRRKHSKPSLGKRSEPIVTE